MTKRERTKKVHDLKKLIRQREELEKMIEDIKDDLKTDMINSNIFEYSGNDWKITFNEYSRSSIDGKGLKEALPQIAEQFTTTTTYRKFLIA